MDILLSGGRLTTYRNDASGEIRVETIFGPVIRIAVDGTVTVYTRSGAIIVVAPSGEISEGPARAG
jgi:hypothetical protein